MYVAMDGGGGFVGNGAIVSQCPRNQNRFKYRGQFRSKAGFASFLAAYVCLQTKNLTSSTGKPHDNTAATQVNYADTPFYNHAETGDCVWGGRGGGATGRPRTIPESGSS